MPLKKNDFNVSFPVFINNSPSPKIMLQLRRYEYLWADGPLWGQCYKPGVLWGHVPSSGGGAGSGMASSQGGFANPWGPHAAVITAPGTGSKGPAPDGFLNTALQHPPHSGHHQLWWQHPWTSFSLHLLFHPSGNSAFSWLFEPWHCHLFRAAGALPFSSILRCGSDIALSPRTPLQVPWVQSLPAVWILNTGPDNVPHLQFWAGKSLVT